MRPASTSCPQPRRPLPTCPLLWDPPRLWGEPQGLPSRQRWGWEDCPGARAQGSSTSALPALGEGSSELQGCSVCDGLPWWLSW